MRRPHTHLAFLVSTLLLISTGCSSMKAEDYAGTEPRFIIEDYFTGKTRAWGIFQDRSGKVRRQFTVDINGAWEGEEFVLREDFSYRDGERQQRTWRIRKLDEHSYVGTAADVVGEARGLAHGQALNWRYTLRVTVGDKTWDINFDDWMFLHEDNILINRAEMKKFGFRVGEVTLVFKRESD